MGTSGLEKPGVESIVHGTHQLGEGRGLCQMLLIERGAGLEHCVHCRRKLLLEPLRLVRAGDPEPDGREEEAAKRERKKELLRNEALDAQRPQRGAEERRVVLSQSFRARSIAQRRKLRRENTRTGV